MTSAIDPSVIGAGNIDKAAVQLQLTRARDEITALQADRVLKAGDTMTGDLVISKITPGIVVNKSAAGQNSFISSQQAGATRWAINIASATVSDFSVGRYDDAGTYLDSPMYFTRATGAPSFANPALWRTGLGASVVGNLVFTATDTAAARSSIAAPAVPIGSAGVGQFTFINPGLAAAAVLPAGGTWACHAMRYYDGVEATFGTYDGNIVTANVAAGGTTVGTGQANRFWIGFAWRFA